jgi:hypothetical protein
LSFVAFESAASGLHVTLRCDKPGGPGSPLTDVTATFVNRSARPMERFSCLAAVPKFLTQTLLPASGDVLPALGAGAVTQVVRLENSQQGVKALALRLRFSWDGGVEQVDVKNFPPGL